MSGFSLTVAATMMCPHGGTVIPVPSSPRASAGGTPVLVATDIFVIAGCPFTLPGPAPSPCVTVRWIVPDMRSKVSGNPTLSQGSTGLCLSPAQAPQGTVIVVSTQTHTQSS
jgi:hypothetical protein